MSLYAVEQAFLVLMYMQEELVLQVQQVGTVWSIPLTGGVSTDGAFHTYMVSNSANGGGIQNNGTLTLTNSVLSKNGSVLNGGAV
jgi:hypothetical protein